VNRRTKPLASELALESCGRRIVPAAEARKVLRELRSEHDSLKQELQTLSQPPVVYVGGDEEVDLVVDLSRVQSARF
jgi:hypothetical protein